MPDRLEEIKQRMAAATLGPWELREYPGEAGLLSIWVGQFLIAGNESCLPPEQERANMEFILHARQDIPYLIRRLEAAEALPKKEVANG